MGQNTIVTSDPWEANPWGYKFPLDKEGKQQESSSFWYDEDGDCAARNKKVVMADSFHSASLRK